MFTQENFNAEKPKKARLKKRAEQEDVHSKFDLTTDMPGYEESEPKKQKERGAKSAEGRKVLSLESMAAAAERVKKLRKEIMGGKKESLNIRKAEPTEPPEQIDLEDGFTATEKKWFNSKPMERKEILEKQAETLEGFYRQELDKLHIEDPEKYPDGKEYLDSSDTLLFMDRRREQKEIELQDKFGYDALKGSWWQKLKMRFKPAGKRKEFKSLLKAYKERDKNYKDANKKHSKKFDEAIGLVTPRAKRQLVIFRRHPELGPPRLW